MRSRIVPVLVALSDTDKASITHVNRNQELFALERTYTTLPKNHGIGIDVIMNRRELVNDVVLVQAKTDADCINHGLTVEHCELLKNLHVIDVVLKKLPLNISKRLRNIRADSFLNPRKKS